MHALISNQFSLPVVGYRLALSDGSYWHLNSDPILRDWLDAFAAIMELDSSPRQTHRNLTYSLRSDPTLPSHFPDKRNSQADGGWESTDIKSLCLWSHKEAGDMRCEMKVMRPSDLADGRSALEIVVMSNALYPVYWQSIRRGGLPFHAALIVNQDRGVLLAASGDTGKSTCCRRLPDGWEPLCDDEALVVLDRSRRYRVHPFPTWSDHVYQRAQKTWNVQHSVPLCGVFFMEQSAIDEVIAIGRGEAVALVNASVNQQACRRYLNKGSRLFQRHLRQQIFANGCNLVQHIPTFKLRVSRKGRFWKNIEQALGW